MPGENYNIGHQRLDGFYYSTFSLKIFLESVNHCQILFFKAME